MDTDIKTKIYIPTRGRVGLNNQVTLREFLANSTHIPVLVCPPDEAIQHREYHSKVMVCHRDGIGPTRQFIIESSSADLVLVLSDDMRFSYRPNPVKIKLERCTALDPLIEVIKQCYTDGFIHGGVGARQGNNHKDLSTPRKGVIRNGHLFTDNERVNDFHFFNRQAVLATGARFDELPVMEDFHFTLTLLTQGLSNTVIHDYVWLQEGSGCKGGCSLYRTAELQAQAANGLAAAFPEFVKVVIKKSKETSTSWADFKERTDVVIQWLKAYNSSQQVNV